MRQQCVSAVMTTFALTAWSDSRPCGGAGADDGGWPSVRMPADDNGLGTAGLLATGLGGDWLGYELGDGDALKEGELLNEGDAL